MVSQEALSRLCGKDSEARTGGEGDYPWWRFLGDIDTIGPLKIHFVLLISRQGKVRLTKWYSPYTQKERSKVIRELSGMILTRGPKLCNFVEWRGFKVVYKRYASLYFCMCINQEDNELEVLEIIHHYVEILDRYFGSVCELDLIFNFHKAYYILDEVLIAGELQESSKKTVARLVAAQDSLVEVAKEEANSISNIIAQATKALLLIKVSDFSRSVQVILVHLFT
ncbi:AP-1 complex subunit sigma-1 [Tanacetum coccineum]